MESDVQTQFVVESRLQVFEMLNGNISHYPVIRCLSLYIQKCHLSAFHKLFIANNISLFAIL